MGNERGSALIITIMLLLILTAIGIYAISNTTSEMDITHQSKIGTTTLNAAEAGAYYGIDQVPNVVTAFATPLPNSASYTVTSEFSGGFTIVPGYSTNFRFANFLVNSEGRSPPPFVAQRAIVSVVNYGPVPIGTMY